MPVTSDSGRNAPIRPLMAVLNEFNLLGGDAHPQRHQFASRLFCTARSTRERSPSVIQKHVRMADGVHGSCTAPDIDTDLI
jgi:hypothetical protein